MDVLIIRMHAKTGVENNRHAHVGQTHGNAPFRFAHLCPWDAGTFGSLSIRHFGVFLREAAAEARGVLMQLASDHLKSPTDRLFTRDGYIYDPSKPDRRMSYGELTKGNIIEKHLKDLPPLKPSSEFETMGKSAPRRDAVEKVTGAAKFSGDIRLDGMLYAKGSQVL